MCRSTPVYAYTHYILFSSILPPPPRSTLFPYTTLFRSGRSEHIGSESCAAHTPTQCGRNPAGSRTSPRWDARKSCSSARPGSVRSEEHTSELQSQSNLVCRLLLEKKKKHNIKL